MKTKRLSIFFLMAMFLFSALVSAEPSSNKMLQRIKNDRWAIRAPWRLMHGVLNAGLGWTQILIEPIHSVCHEAQNLAEGISDGIGESVYYTLIGVWDIGTFWVPGKYGQEIAATDCIMKQIVPSKCCSKNDEASL